MREEFQLRLFQSPSSLSSVITSHCLLLLICLAQQVALLGVPARHLSLCYLLWCPSDLLEAHTLSHLKPGGHAELLGCTSLLFSFPPIFSQSNSFSLPQSVSVSFSLTLLLSFPLWLLLIQADRAVEWTVVEDCRGQQVSSMASHNKPRKQCLPLLFTVLVLECNICVIFLLQLWVPSVLVYLKTSCYTLTHFSHQSLFWFYFCQPQIFLYLISILHWCVPDFTLLFKGMFPLSNIKFYFVRQLKHCHLWVNKVNDVPRVTPLVRRDIGILCQACLPTKTIP